MSGILQRGGQWVIDQVAKLEAEAERRRVEISENNGAIVAANARANTITDPVVRKNVQDGLHHLAERQGVIAQAWRTFWGKASDIATSARTWLRANGYSNGLSGLGAVPVIPIVIIVGLTAGAVIWVANDWIKKASLDAQRPSIASMTQLVNSRLAGQINDAQFAAMAKQVRATADATMPKDDPLGLANLSAALPMIAIVAALVIFGPTLARSLGRRTQGAH